MSCSACVVLQTNVSVCSVLVCTLRKLDYDDILNCLECFRLLHLHSSLQFVLYQYVQYLSVTNFAFCYFVA
jgi:hypothetical protein